MAFLPMVSRQDALKVAGEPVPSFEIIVTTVEPSNQIEEQVILETPVVVEQVMVQETPVVVVEQTQEPTPEPVNDVVVVQPEPQPTEAPIQEAVSGDIVSTDSKSTEDADESLNAETAPHMPEGAIPIIVKISHYNPALGGPNCARFVNGECISKMSNGERWQDYIEDERTIACPMEVPFGSNIYLDYVEYTCRDRGGAIVITYEGYYWIDILADRVPYSYGELRDAYLYIP